MEWTDLQPHIRPTASYCLLAFHVCPSLVARDGMGLGMGAVLRVKPKLPGAKTGSCRFPDTTGVWTMASARALRQPSVMVQVFQIEVGICASYEA